MSFEIKSGHPIVGSEDAAIRLNERRVYRIEIKCLAHLEYANVPKV